MTTEDEYSPLVAHAERELTLLLGDRPMTGKEEALELVRVFSAQGHSGSSAGYVTELFYKLAQFKPLLPLTGEAAEWNEVGDNTYQNNRSSCVFRKGPNGPAYTLDGYYFAEPNGCTFSSRYSFKPVSFPYWPKPAQRVKRPSLRYAWIVAVYHVNRWLGRL